MSLTEPTLADPVTPADAWQQAANRSTPFGQYFGEKLLGGIEATRPAAALEEAMLPGRLHGDISTVIGGGTDEYGRQSPGMGVVGPAEGQAMLPKAAWEASPSYRPSLTWDEGMTPARAEALATQHDRLEWNKSLIERYQGGFMGQAAGFVAGLAPGIADPTNYIPLLGAAAKAAMVARLGAIGGNIALHGAEAAANTALFEPLTAEHAATFGQPYGWQDAAADIALGALAGAIGGAIHGGLEYRGSLREAATRTRLDTVMAAADATSLAADQIDRGEAVNIAPVLEGRLPEAPRPTTFDVGSIVPRRAGEGATEPPPLAERAEPMAAAPATPPRTSRGAFTLPAEANSFEKPTEVLVNPTRAEVGKLLRDASHGSRMLVDPRNGDLYAWEGDSATHSDVIKYLGIPAGPEGKDYLSLGTGKGHLTETWPEIQAEIDKARRRSPSFATAAPEPPHPSAAEAAKRVGKTADPLATFKQDAGLEGYEKPLPGHEPKPEPVPGEAAKPAKPERPPTREEKAAALAALPPELAEIEAMRREGSFLPEDERTLAAGEAEAQRAEQYASAWSALASCVARNA